MSFRMRGGNENFELIEQMLLLVNEDDDEKRKDIMNKILKIRD